jgi:hypothetical protein
MPQPAPPPSKATASKANKELLFKGVTLALIGLVILLAPYVARSTSVRELMSQAALVGWFALVLGIAFGVQYGMRRAKAGPPLSCRPELWTAPPRSKCSGHYSNAPRRSASRCATLRPSPLPAAGAAAMAACGRVFWTLPNTGGKRRCCSCRAELGDLSMVARSRTSDR